MVEQPIVIRCTQAILRCAHATPRVDGIVFQTREAFLSKLPDGLLRSWVAAKIKGAPAPQHAAGNARHRLT